MKDFNEQEIYLLNRELDQLEIENEGLQSLNDFNVQKIETLEAENEELRVGRSRGMLAFLEEDFKKEQKIKKYKQCLDEIEEYIQFILDQWDLDTKETQDKVIYLIDKIRQVKEH